MSTPAIPDIKIYLSKENEADFINILRERQIKFTSTSQTFDEVGATIVLLFITIINSKPACVALAAVIVAYLKIRHGAKITITDKNRRIIKGEGLSESELVKVLEHAEKLQISDERKENPWA